MSQDETTQVPDFLQIFKERSQVTQLLYQTLIQESVRYRPKDLKGISPSDAELFHSLSAAVAALTAISSEERRSAWKSIQDISSLALKFFPNCQVGASSSGDEVKSTT